MRMRNIMRNAECGMRNERQNRGQNIIDNLGIDFDFNSAFRIPHSAFRILFCAILALALFAPAIADDVGKANKKANRLYSKGKYEEALKLYEDALLLDPSDKRLKMNRGSALYRLGDLDNAENAYLDALSQGDKKTLADAHYNLGNILYKQGEQLEQAGSAAQARGKYSQALENYVNTLKLRPNDKDAKWNLQLAHKKVNLLENKEDQEQEQNQDQQDQKDNKDKKDDKDSKDQKEDKQQDDKDSQDQREDKKSQKEQDMKKDEAERLIEQYADDSDSLNKPIFQRGKIRQPEKDW